MKKFFKIVGFLLLILIAVFIIWFSKNWAEAGQRITTSENYSKLNQISASGPATQNEILFFKMKNWTQDSYWPCSGFHLKRHVSHAIDKDFLTDWDQKKPMIEWHKSRAFIACRLERDFSSGQVRNYFFENVFIGNREYGVEKLAQSQFGKSFDELSEDELTEIKEIIARPAIRNEPLFPSERN